MKNYLPPIVMCALIFLGCKAPDMGCLTGEYESVRFSKIRMGLDYVFRGKVYPYGYSLKLNEDSTFTYTSCTIQKGNWQTNADTLLLFVKEHRWTNDSLHKHSWNGRHPQLGDTTVPTKFTIAGNRVTMVDDKFVIVMKKQEAAETATVIE